MIVRKAEKNDLDNIKDLNKRIFVNNSQYDSDSKLDFAHTNEGDKYFRKAIENKDGVFFVAIDDGKMIGYVNGETKLIQHRISNYFEVDNLGVVPESKGKGIGKMLLEKVTRWAKEHGYNKIYLSCYVKNVEALAFYKRNDFVEIDLGLEKSI